MGLGNHLSQPLILQMRKLIFPFLGYFTSVQPKITLICLQAKMALLAPWSWWLT